MLWRVGREFMHDRVMLVAAGATFYLLLAIFPGLAVMVSVFGLVADPHRIAPLIDTLRGIVPTSAIDILDEQLASLAGQSSAALTFGFAVGLLFALWSANNGIKTLFEAMNIAYEETEKRSFVRLNLLALLFTLGGMIVAFFAIVGVGVVPAVLGFVGFAGATETLMVWLRWPLLFAVSVVGIALVYRYGPSRRRARWRWVVWASVLVTLAWLATAMLFSWYLSRFADYNATYGSLGAVIGFLMWTWVSLVVLIMGAELAAEAEHQTACDSTVGPDRPMGERGATMADTLGAARPGVPEVPAPKAPSSGAVVARGAARRLRLAAAVCGLAAGWMLGRIGRYLSRGH